VYTPMLVARSRIREMLADTNATEADISTCCCCCPPLLVRVPWISIEPVRCWFCCVRASGRGNVRLVACRPQLVLVK
jgi:hypothetical protein